MNMIEVTSSNITKIGHDAATSTMAVQFNGGAVYHYSNVSAAKFEEFKTAPSIGGYFAMNFKKNPDHPFQRQAR